MVTCICAQEQEIITEALLERHARRMERAAERPWKTGEKIKFCR
ncbi:MAG: hypothetical protein ACLFU8_01920 [Anaerolineales bacterium]